MVDSSASQYTTVMTVCNETIWTYEIQFWGGGSKSNIQSIQRFQNIGLRDIIDTSWYFKTVTIIEFLKWILSIRPASNLQRVNNKSQPNKKAHEIV